MTDFFLSESSIEDSYIYKSFNASTSLIDKIVKYLKTSTKLDYSYFEEQYMQMKKVSMSPLSQKVIDSFNDGDIEILFSRDEKVGRSIPFIIRRNESGKIIATIFINAFTSIDSNSNLTIPVKQLYALMESAYVALEMQRSPMKVQRNVGIMKIVSSVYVEMIMRILNKEYAITLDKVLYDKVTYVVTRFFLEKVWEYPNVALIQAYSTSELKYIESLDLDLITTGYTHAGIKDVKDMLEFLKTLSPRLNNLNVRFYIEKYTNTYHGSSILSIDYLPYVFFVIINVILGSFLINQTALNDIIKNTKNISKFYVELAKTI